MKSTFEAILSGIEPPPKSTILRTINGIGARFSGRLNIPETDQFYITGYWIVIFFIPIFPLGFYLMKSKSSEISDYHIVGKISFRTINNAYGKKFWFLFGSAWFEGLVFLVIFAFVIGGVFFVFSLFRR